MRVGLVDHHRHAQGAGGDHRRQRGIAPHAHDHRRPAAAHDAERGDDREDRVPRGAEVGGHARRIEPALEAPTGEQVDAEARGGHRGGLDPAAGADEVDGVTRVTARDELLGEREGREHVTAGAAPGDEDVGGGHRSRDARRACGARLWIATFTRIPDASIVVMSAEPPNDT